MLADSLIDAGALREGLYWADLNTAELRQTGAPWRPTGCRCCPLYLLGEWDEAVRRGSELRDGWLAEGRPPIAYFSANLACIAAIHGLRGDEAGAGGLAALRRAGSRTAASTSCPRSASGRPRSRCIGASSSERWSCSSPWIRISRAATCYSPSAPRRWSSAGHPDALGDRRGAAPARTTNAGGHPSRWRCARARPDRRASDEVLAEACAAFERLECVYEVARTRWLRGGEHREPAAETFAGLGVTAPS